MPAWKDNDGKMLQPVKMAKATAAGPLAFMVVHRQGLMRRVASSMIAGFLIHVIGAFLLCFMMLMVSLGGVAHRSMFRTDRRSTASISKQELVAFPYGLHLGVDCESCDRSYLEAERSAHRLGFGSVN